MLEDHARVMQVLALAGEVVGRKKLQKIVYITQKLEFDLNERFRFHFYGPYSEELTLKIEELCDLEFLQEELENKGNYNVYRYSVTDQGRDFLSQTGVGLEGAGPVVTRLNGCSARFLELVSTVYYFQNLSREEVEEKIWTLKAKSNYTLEEIDQAYSFIAELKDMRHAQSVQ